jgi:heterodisulfide reductase subunit A
MALKKLKAQAITADVNRERCSGCGICIELCPYNAINKDEFGIAQVTSVVCKGCGICGSSCPERAIIMHHFTNDQLEAQALASIERSTR